MLTVFGVVVSSLGEESAKRQDSQKGAAKEREGEREKREEDQRK